MLIPLAAIGSLDGAPAPRGFSVPGPAAAAGRNGGTARSPVGPCRHECLFADPA
jgi:hypothetical protein